VGLPKYIGIFLTPASRRALLKEHPPIHENVHADHITLRYDPSEADLESFPVGTLVKVRSSGYVEDGKAQAITVELPAPWDQLKNRDPHITISTAPGVEPVHSNTIVGRARRIGGRTYTGILDWDKRKAPVQHRWFPMGSARTVHLWKRMPWELSLREFMRPYPEPKPGYTSLFHYTKGNVEQIARQGLKASGGAVFAHRDPEHTRGGDKPLIHFQAPTDEVRRESGGGSVTVLYRDVDADDVLSTHRMWPDPTGLISGRIRPGMRSDIGEYAGSEVKELHRRYVEAALLTDKPVSENVLNDHPDLDPGDYSTFHYKRYFRTDPRLKMGRTLKQAHSCPIRTQLYGGLPSDGGFGRITEFEVGAARIAEAAHCILGSLGRDVSGIGTWKALRDQERGHVKEEIGIIEHAIKEYSRPLYAERLTDFSDYKPEYMDRMREYADKSVASIRENAPRAMEMAKREGMKLLQQKDIPQSTINVAVASYAVVRQMGAALLRAVEDYPEHVGNAYTDPKLQMAVKKLRTWINIWFKASDEELDKPAFPNRLNDKLAAQVAARYLVSPT